MSGKRRGVLWIGLALAMTGCWSSVYEQRFQNTQILFARMALRNQHLLETPWSDKGGISLRIPRGFEEIPPPPPPPAPAEGEPEVPHVPEHDNRQPNMLTVVLPGMRGAFAQGGQYIYILSSRDIKKSEGDTAVIELPGTDPTKFGADICRLVGDSTGFEIDYTKFVATNFPQSRVPFVLQKSFKAANVDFTQALDDGSTRDWRIMMHFFDGSDSSIQVAVLVVEPKSEANTSFKAAIDLALETFELNEKAFKSAGGEGTAGSAPGI